MSAELPDNTEVTVATEVPDLLPRSLLEHGGTPGPLRPEDDRTVLADPVEQAILVDRTRPRRPSTGRPPRASSRYSVARSEPHNETVPDKTAVEVVVEPRLAPPPPPSPPPALSDSAPDSGSSDGLFGNYRVVAPLPATELGPTFLAEHCRMGFTVVIKTLQPALVGLPELEKRFFAQAMVTSRIAHPSVAMVLDFGHDQRGIPYLAAEYLEGATLATYLAGGNLFSIEQILDIGAQVAAALAAAHGCGVLHRDIRPENIHLLADAGAPGRLRVKLLDFGVPGPDHIPAVAGADERADVYGLGCVLYRMLTGRPPFAGRPDEAGCAPISDGPLPPRFHRAGIPAALDALVHRMVAERPDERPGSMVEVERALRAVSVGPETIDDEASGSPGRSPSTTMLVRAPGAGLSWRQMAVRHPRWSAACIAAALFVGAVGLLLILG